MKCLILFTALLVIVLAEDDPHGLKAAFTKCRPAPPPRPEGEPQSGPPPDHPPHDHGHPHGPPVEVLKCTAKELNLIDADGNVNEAGIKLHVEHVETDANKVSEVVKTCAENQSSGDETVKHLWKCLHDKNIFQHNHPAHKHGSDESGSSESEEHHHRHH